MDEGGDEMRGCRREEDRSLLWRVEKKRRGNVNVLRVMKRRWLLAGGVWCHSSAGVCIVMGSCCSRDERGIEKYSGRKEGDELVREREGGRDREVLRK